MMMHLADLAKKRIERFSPNLGLTTLRYGATFVTRGIRRLDRYCRRAARRAIHMLSTARATVSELGNESMNQHFAKRDGQFAQVKVDVDVARNEGDLARA